MFKRAVKLDMQRSSYGLVIGLGFASLCLASTRMVCRRQKLESRMLLNKSNSKSRGEIKKMKLNNNRPEVMDKHSGRGDSQVTTGSSSRSSIFDCSDIMREILSRLPVKSLLRFKCVCKYWQFTISQDRDLIDLHFTRAKQHSPDLFIVVPRHNAVDHYQREMPYGPYSDFMNKRTCNGNNRPRHIDGYLISKYMASYRRMYRGVKVYKQSFLLGNLFENRSAHTMRKLQLKPFLDYTAILKPVNGLICFINRSNAKVCVLNPSTGEETPWIASSLFKNKKYNITEDLRRGIWLPNYFFGFDPATKRHKVICTWRVREASVIDNTTTVRIGEDMWWADISEVLTVGENIWRSIDTKVPCSNDKVRFSYDTPDSVYSNGFVYWCDRSAGIPKHLNAFDVGCEKFKVIEVPKEIREKSDNAPGGLSRKFHSLIEVSGHIALLQRWTGKFVKLWICEDDAPTGSYSEWNEVTMKLPFKWDDDMYDHSPCFHGVAGEDRIIIESYPIMSRSDIKTFHLYSYDWKKKTMVKSDVVSLSSTLKSVSMFRSFTESLWPVGKPKFRHNQQVMSSFQNSSMAGKHPCCDGKDDAPCSSHVKKIKTKPPPSPEMMHLQALLETAIDSLKFEINNLEVGVKCWRLVEANAKTQCQMTEASAKAGAVEKTLGTKKVELEAKEAELAALPRDNIAC